MRPGPVQVEARERDPHVGVWLLDPHRLADPTVLLGLLSEQEQARAARLEGPRRLLYTASRALVRAAVAARTGTDPGGVGFTRRCSRCGHPTHGKPRLEPTALGGPVEVSLSRTAGMVALALSGVPVGIDVEHVGAPLGPLELAQVLRGTDAERLARTGGESHVRSCYEAWVAREALGKARGSGLVGVRDLQVGQASRSRWCRVVDGAERWQVRLLDVGPGHACALVTPAGPAVVELLDPPAALRLRQ